MFRILLYILYWPRTLLISEGNQWGVKEAKVEGFMVISKANKWQSEGQEILKLHCRCNKVYCLLNYKTLFGLCTASNRESAATSLWSSVEEEQRETSCAPKPGALGPHQPCLSLPIPRAVGPSGSTAGPVPASTTRTGPQPTWDAQGWGSHHAPPGCPAFLLGWSDRPGLRRTRQSLEPGPALGHWPKHTGSPWQGADTVKWGKWGKQIDCIQKEHSHLQSYDSLPLTVLVASQEGSDVSNLLRQEAEKLPEQNK